MARPIALVRIAAGIPEADVLRVATSVAHGADPSTNRLQALTQPLAGAYRDTYLTGAVPLLAGGVLLVFLVLCANVSSLLLERFTSRRREFAMCSALGASRGRLFRQALVESAMFGTLGAATGIAIAWTLVGVTRGFLPESFLLQTLNPLNVDYRAIAAASLSGFLATAAAGVLPAWIGTTTNAANSLRVVEPRRHRDTSRSFSYAGAPGRRNRARVRAPRGRDASRALVRQPDTRRSRVELARRGDRVDHLQQAISTIPRRAQRQPPSWKTACGSCRESANVALSFGLPPGGGGISFGDWQPDTAGRVAGAHDRGALLGRHRLLRPLRHPAPRGPDLPADRSDDTGGRVIVGQRMAAALWPGTSAVGRRFTFLDAHFEVIGVAKEINHPSIDSGWTTRSSMSRSPPAAPR